MTGQEQTRARVGKMLLELNKTGLSYLKYMKYPEAAQFFKKAERIVMEELEMNGDNLQINQLAGVTFNNLACYYKKTRKPKVALAYLQRSLELDVFKVNDWVSTGSTHLNICAIHSFLGRHDEALNHAVLALNLLDKTSFTLEDQSDSAKSFWNIKMLSYYNKAIEEEHLRAYELALESYRHAKEVGETSRTKNETIIQVCEEAITRLEANLSNLRKRMLSVLLKRKGNYESGHCQFILYNKKHALKQPYPPEPPAPLVRKFARYRSVTLPRHHSPSNSKAAPEQQNSDQMRDYLAGQRISTQPV